VTGLNAAETSGGRPAFVVNVEVLLHRDGRWLLIKRGAEEKHAPGSLAGVGGKAEVTDPADVPNILEATARREVDEEIGVDISGVALTYVESGYFTSDDGDPVINIVFTGPLPADAQPFPASPEEVAGIVWLTTAEAETDSTCPPWTLRALRRAEPLR